METSNTRRRQFIVGILAVSSLTVFTLIALEIMLQVAARIFPSVDAVLFPPQFRSSVPVVERSSVPVVEPELSDAELGIRGNPRFPEHDANGFRNRGVPDTTDIVAIGDSHTYGTSVTFDQAWPRLLEKATSCRVYSMAFGGYGPLQYAILAERALRFKPRLILVAIYFGNDFFDNWEMYLRSPSKYPVPRELLTEALEREQRKPLSDEVENFYNEWFYNGWLPETASGPSWSPRYFLAQNSALWGFARAIKIKLFSLPNGTGVLSGEFRTAVAALTPKQAEHALVFQGPDWKTILTTRYRESAENTDDPRIAVGIWLTKWAIQHIDQAAKQNGIKTIFILLPTKESVFVNKVKVADKYFRKLMTDEEQIRQDLIGYMKKNDFAHVDMAPSLRSMVQQPYFEDADGHPNPVGQQAIATRLEERVGACNH